MSGALLRVAIAILATACSTAKVPDGPPPSASSPSPSATTPPVAQPAPELSAAERARLVEAVARQFDAHYVFPDVGTRMTSALRDKAAHGGYDAITTSSDFAHVVTDDLRAVSHDRHAMLDYRSPDGPKTAEDIQWDREDEENHKTAGFGAVERLPGKVARLVVNSFEYLNDARAAVTDHLSQIADADALIVDLRNDSGGDPATVAFVLSYLFDPPRVHLNDMWWRDDGSTDAFWTLPDVPGKRFGGRKPVFVLTSARTFSAAEEFAYDLQALHRGVIVGETTKGGAHPVARQKLTPSLTVRVPTGRAINPVTKKNWEQVGVVPDVPTTADDALRQAHVRALKALLAAPKVDAATRAKLQAALAALEPK